jgi:hypothetical protein
LAVRATDFDKNINPVLFQLAENYEKFYCAYSDMDSNYKKAQIFSNKFFCQAESSDNYLDVQFFGRQFYADNKNYLRKLTFSDCFRGDVFKSVEEWREDGLPLTLNMWLRLRNAIIKKRNLLKNCSKNEKSMDVAEFVGKIKKGSRRVRGVFERYHEKGLTLNSQPVFASFKYIINFTPTVDTYLKNWVVTWKINALSNDLKYFIFQCRFNSLPTNNRLHAYRLEIDPRCTFCRINDDKTDTWDSFCHLFYNCPVTISLLKEFFKKIDIPFNDDIYTRDIYWYGIYDKDDKCASTLTCFTITFDVFRYILYKFKARRIVPVFADLYDQIIFVLKCIGSANKKIMSAFSKNKNLSRLIQALG